MAAYPLLIAAGFASMLLLTAFVKYRNTARSTAKDDEDFGASFGPQGIPA
jgi:hypothetical protein